jgi:small GTP-binding protein
MTLSSIHRGIALKVILLGNPGVGKTSLVTRWMDNHWDPEVVPTVGTSNNLRNVKLGQKSVKIALWDTAGQEQFRSITPLYIRGARVAIIVTATDSPESFDAIPSWLEILGISEEKPIPALLAVNKIDFRDPWGDDTLSKAIESNRSRFVTVFAVSAATGQDVEELFREAVRIADTSISEQKDANESPILIQSSEQSKCC